MARGLAARAIVRTPATFLSTVGMEGTRMDDTSSERKEREREDAWHGPFPILLLTTEADDEEQNKHRAILKSCPALPAWFH